MLGLNHVPASLVCAGAMSSAEGLSAAQKTQQQDTIDLMRANEYGPVARAIVKHLDGRGRRNLLAANRACRQWVLSTAPAARLQLSLATDFDETAGKARLGVLRECLRERRARPVCLALTGLGTYASIDRLGPIPYNLLHNAGGSITQLVVSSTDHRQPPTAANIRYFLKSAATALPSLTSLDLQGVTFPLPPPPSLPSLTHITLSIPCDAVAPIIDSACQELAKYLPHIHTLAIWQPQREQFLAASPTWPQLFSTGATSDSLVSFATDLCLSDQLLGLLITHAPALRSLTVGRLGVWEGGCREREWGVGELRVCRGDRPAAQEITVCAERLANLPRSREGCLEVRGATRLELRLNEVLVRDMCTQHTLCVRPMCTQHSSHTRITACTQRWRDALRTARAVQRTMTQA